MTTTLEMQKAMQEAIKKLPANSAIVLLVAPFGEGSRQFQWICNCRQEDGAQVVIDMAKKFEQSRN